MLTKRFPGNWFLVWRDITCATNERTSIAALIPKRPCAHTLSLVDSLSAENALLFAACLNSFVDDFCARQKVVGTHLNHTIWKQLPVLPMAVYVQHCIWATKAESFKDWIVPRALELSYTAWDLKGFAKDCGYGDPPFRWNDKRRFLLRCELDALFFHLYLGSAQDWANQATALRKSLCSPRDAVFYIMDTFPIVKKRDEQEHEGHYRTKDTILEMYDEMSEAARTGVPYQTRLNPPPADPSVAQSAETPPVLGVS